MTKTETLTRWASTLSICASILTFCSLAVVFYRNSIKEPRP